MRRGVGLEQDDESKLARGEVDAASIAQAHDDRAAFIALFRFYVPGVYSFCRAHSTAREEAEGLTAQTFERAMATIGRYDGQERFSSWLLRIAAHATIDRTRRGARTATSGDEELAPDDDATHPGAIRWVEQWERSTWIKAHLALLPDEEQQVVKRRYYDDQSIADMAEEMGKSEDAVKQLEQQVLKELRAAESEEASGDV